MPSHQPWPDGTPGNGAGRRTRDRERSSEWLGALRNDDDRRDWRGFSRRSRQAHPVLHWLMVGSFVGATGARLLGSGDDAPPWPIWLWLGGVVIAFVCFVLLVRRDDPPPEC